MIKVERCKCPPALDASDPNSPGQVELAKLSARLASGEVLKSDDFKAYRREEVRDALKDMFNGKCAYCERPVAGGGGEEIEHYRPKKGVSEADELGIDHPGYWWLAMDWSNLVLSCEHCNQWRKRQVEIPDDVVTVEELKTFFESDPRATGSGKQNSFPTADNVWITDPAADVASEKPLIIDPSADGNPEDHLDWVIFKGASTVRAKNGSKAGEASRKILGLNRRWLEEERRAQLGLMQVQHNRIISKLQDWVDEENPAVKDYIAQTVDELVDDLLVYLDKKQPFIGLARAYIKSIKEEVAIWQSNAR